jgi:menaquinol-cytochrome c reductase iron-sulfur subunit
MERDMSSKYRSPVLDRRGFVKIVSSVLGSVMAALVGLPVIGFFISPAFKKASGDEWISLGPLENYPPGSPTLFNFTLTNVNGWERSSKSYGVFVLKSEDGKVEALSDVCTHLSCRVNWKEEEQEFACPCHAASFDRDGNLKSGPPPRPMDRYETRLEEDQLFIYLREG